MEVENNKDLASTGVEEGEEDPEVDQGVDPEVVMVPWVGLVAFQEEATVLLFRGFWLL